MKHVLSLYIHDLKVATANILMLLASFANIDIFIKVVAFIVGTIYTIQRIIYNYQQRQEEKARFKKELEDSKVESKKPSKTKRNDSSKTKR